MDSQDNFVPYFKNRHYKPTKKKHEKHENPKNNYRRRKPQ